jgi:4-diphosphocytidyl-2-C-methyl-D-erythritol kinase
LKIAAAVGSDLPLFLIGGTVLGVGRGEEVYPAPDLAEVICVVATPDIGVSTPEAFRDWDSFAGRPGRMRTSASTWASLTSAASSDRINEFGRRVSGWLSSDLSGVPGSSGRGRAGNPLLDLVRTGIENDFEQVVFPKYPELREVKRVLEEAGAFYASLSGSGSALYGLFRSQAAAKRAVAQLSKTGTPSVVTRTLRRQQYWKKWLVRDF